MIYWENLSCSHYKHGSCFLNLFVSLKGGLRGCFGAISKMHEERPARFSENGSRPWKRVSVLQTTTRWTTGKAFLRSGDSMLAYLALSTPEKYPPTRPYCPRTCVESCRGKNGNERKRRLWRNLLGRSTTKTLEDKVSVPSSYLHSCNDNRWWVMVSKTYVCGFLLFVRGSRARRGLFFFCPWWRTAQQAKRNSRHAPRPGEHPNLKSLMWCKW